MVALHHARPADDLSELDAARADVERLSHGLPPAAMGAWPDDVRRASRAHALAVAAAARRRALVGERPQLDEDAVAAVLAAHRGVDEARACRREAIAEGHRLLAIGNAWAAIALAGAGLLVSQGVEPMATAVYAAVAGAAAGPVTMSVIGVGRRSLATIKVDAARAAWARALEVAGFATMGQLHATRIALAAWRRREAEADAAEAAVEAARARWHELVGDGFSPIEGPLLAFRLASLRSAQLRLLHALLVEASCPVEGGTTRHAPPDRTEAARPAAGSAAEPTRRPVAVDGAPSLWLLRLGRRLRGR
jgi:hypothetical protein